jgi:hypothetical protein
MTGRLYSVSFVSVAITAIQDLFQLITPSDRKALIHSVTISQETDYGDANAEGLPIQISRFSGTEGTGGTAGTESPLDPESQASTSLTEVNNTTQALTTTVLHAEAWNIQAPFYYKPTPEERIKMDISDGLVVELSAAPTDSITCSGTLVWEEV